MTFFHAMRNMSISSSSLVERKGAVFCRLVSLSPLWKESGEENIFLRVIGVGKDAILFHVMSKSLLVMHSYIVFEKDDGILLLYSSHLSP